MKLISMPTLILAVLYLTDLHGGSGSGNAGVEAFTINVIPTMPAARHAEGPSITCPVDTKAATALFSTEQGQVGPDSVAEARDVKDKLALVRDDIDQNGSGLDWAKVDTTLASTNQLTGAMERKALEYAPLSPQRIRINQLAGNNNLYHSSAVAHRANSDHVSLRADAVLLIEGCGDYICIIQPELPA